MFLCHLDQEEWLRSQVYLMQQTAKTSAGSDRNADGDDDDGDGFAAMQTTLEVAKWGFCPHGLIGGSARILFNGCRLRRRPPDINYFMDFTVFHVFNTPFIDFNEVSRHTRTTGRDTVVQRPRFPGQIHFPSFQIHVVVGKTKINTFAKHSTFSTGLQETLWGKMSVMTMGSFHIFTKIVSLTCFLQVKVLISPKPWFSRSLFEEILLL